MTSPSSQERAEISRFGMFDKEKFDELVAREDLAPRCAGWPIDEEACTEVATHVTRCRSCKNLARLLCSTHADRVPLEQTEMQHELCGAHGPLCKLMAVAPI